MCCDVRCSKGWKKRVPNTHDLARSGPKCFRPFRVSNWRWVWSQSDHVENNNSNNKKKLLLSNFLLGRTNESPAFCVRTATDSLGGQENRFQEQHTCLSRLERAGRERPQIAPLKRFWRSGQVLSFTKNLGLEWQAMCAPTKAITIDVRVWCEREREKRAFASVCTR